MTDLADFLLARIAEDETAAGSLLFETGTEGVSDVRSPIWEAQQFSGSVRGFAERWTPARVLAECDAKRRVVEEEHHNVNDGDCGTCVRGQWGYPTHGGALPERWPCPTLRLLALPYADHPDYREEWRP